ncbi:putative wrky transcription factor 53 [Nicotiana attenuata]|uniref:Wrky transcription factor 53 n=1 Tax=Nicotiana attenuata TaxID=49451 RepID=A0A1J6L762_NICAT|nr:putative wrky transcription factor 53 [Nicotiana attenuata]
MQIILSSFENSLSILKWTDSITQTQQIVVAPPPSISVDEISTKTDDLNGNFKDNDQDLRYVSKKRKQLPTWTEQVRVSAENGFEGPTDDGYSWRKYGQKDILGYCNFVWTKRHSWLL